MEDTILLEKLDAIVKRLETLETPPEEPKEDVGELRDAKTITVLKGLLKGSFSDEKLDGYTLDELLIAASLKEDFTPEIGIMPPTGGDTETDQKEDALAGIPEHMLAHYPPESGLEGLIK